MSPRVLAVLAVAAALAVAASSRPHDVAAHAQPRAAGTAASPSDPIEASRAIAAASGFHTALSFSVDGRVVAWSNEHGEGALFVANTGGDPARAERLDVREPWPRDPQLSPDGGRIVYRSFGDESGTPFTDLYLYDRKSATSTRLTAPGTRNREEVSCAAWSPDGRAIVYQRSWLDGEWQFEVRILDPATHADRVLVTERGLVAHAPAWSPDGRSVAFVSEPDLWLVDVTSGQRHALTEWPRDTTFAPGRAFPDAPVWSRDGRSLLVATAQGDDCFRVLRIDAASGRATTVTRDACAMRPQPSPDGEHIVYLRLGSSARTLAWSRADGSGEEPLGRSDGVWYNYGFGGDGALYAMGSPADAPRAIFKIDTAAAPRRAQAWATPSLKLPARFVSRPRYATVRAPDGLEVPLWIFPRTEAPDAAGAALLWLHGGPEEDVAPRWYPEIQALANRGVTVYALNYRGSTGNGTRFRKLSRDRTGQIGDVAAAIRAIAARPDVARSGLGLLMVSYASGIGYAAAARTDEIAAIVDWLGAPRSISSELATARRRPPMLWLSGDFDPITPARDRLAAELVRDGLPLTTRHYRVGHSVLPGDERARLLEDVARFLDTRLKRR